MKPKKSYLNGGLDIAEIVNSKREHNMRNHTVDEQRVKSAKEHQIKQRKNKEELLKFQEDLENFFSEEICNYIRSCFTKWEKCCYRREATLAYHDIKNKLEECHLYNKENEDALSMCITLQRKRLKLDEDFI